MDVDNIQGGGWIENINIICAQACAHTKETADFPVQYIT